MCEVEVLDEDDDDDEEEEEADGGGSSSSAAAGGGSGGGGVFGGGKRGADGGAAHRAVGEGGSGGGLGEGVSVVPDDDSDTIHMSQKRGSRVSKGPPSLAPLSNAFGSSLPRADPLLVQVI